MLNPNKLKKLRAVKIVVGKIPTDSHTVRNMVQN